MIGLETIRALKGCPLAVLVALVISQQPVSLEWLARITGYSDKPVTQGLKLLSELGYVTRNGRYSWQINAANAIQLPLSTTRNNSDSLTATTTIIETTKELGRSSKQLTRNNSNSRIIEVLNCAGVMHPTDKEIASMGLDLEFVKAHIRKANSEGIERGLLVHRLRCKDPIEVEHKDYLGRYADFINH